MTVSKEVLADCKRARGPDQNVLLKQLTQYPGTRQQGAPLDPLTRTQRPLHQPRAPAESIF